MWGLLARLSVAWPRKLSVNQNIIECNSTPTLPYPVFTLSAWPVWLFACPGPSFPALTLPRYLALAFCPCPLALPLALALALALVLPSTQYLQPFCKLRPTHYQHLPTCLFFIGTRTKLDPFKCVDVVSIAQSEGSPLHIITERATTAKYMIRPKYRCNNTVNSLEFVWKLRSFGLLSGSAGTKYRTVTTIVTITVTITVTTQTFVAPLASAPFIHRDDHLTTHPHTYPDLNRPDRISVWRGVSVCVCVSVFCVFGVGFLCERK